MGVGVGWHVGAWGCGYVSSGVEVSLSCCNSNTIGERPTQREDFSQSWDRKPKSRGCRWRPGESCFLFAAALCSVWERALAFLSPVRPQTPFRRALPS